MFCISLNFNSSRPCDAAHLFSPLCSYGLVWISTTLVFLIASLGNCATFLMNRKADPNISWTFDVNYVNVAAGTIYGYALIVPLGYYFLLQYLGSSVSLVRFWCLWGYSLFIFILTSVSIIWYHSPLFMMFKSNNCTFYKASLHRFSEKSLMLTFDLVS